MPAFIPSYQTLGLGSGWNCRRAAPLPYPLGHDRVRKYYLGRNAVFHGARALGLGEGDEILFPAYHSGTESAPLFHLGCRLSYYGVRRDLTIDLDEIEAKITPATRAIYAIHFFGFPAPMAALRAMADRHGLPLIEDAALSFLAQCDGRQAGAWGDVSIFCLYKSLPVAAGGVLAINRPDISLPPEPRESTFYSELNLTAKHVLNHFELHGGLPGKLLRRCAQRVLGRAVSAARLKVTSPDALAFDPGLLDRRMGWLTRCIVGSLDFARVIERRRANYAWMAAALQGTQVKLLRDDLPTGAVPLFLPILVDDKFGAVARLHEEGIDAIPVWGIHHPYLPRGEFRDVEFLVDRAVEIPIHQSLELRHLLRIRDALLRHAAWPEYAPNEPGPWQGDAPAEPALAVSLSTDAGR